MREENLTIKTTYSDNQLREQLKLNGKLQELGNDLVSAIKSYGKYSKHGMSPHMEMAVSAWKRELEKNYARIP